MIMADQHCHCRCTTATEGLENMEDVDLEEQLAPPPPSPLPSSAEPLHGLCRKPGAGSHRALVATPVRALWMVVLMVGLLFTVHLLVHDVRTFVLLVAESFCIFFVMSGVAACERRQHDASGGACRGFSTVAEVALWSFAMALTVTMTFWVAAGMSLPAVAALYLLSLLVVSACFAVLLGA
ncbi:Os01g0503300 [Oryza sativa Japonica Group]|uniref:Os01g0503300 protein n=4 Tax=Oryza TaxID=4527 RepID=A0A0P0V302_ORYSJ|nr:Os01g0503300 [Oryza sativa Japonica Group]